LLLIIAVAIDGLNASF